MHCDFAVMDKRNKKLCFGIEIDGPYHDDSEQIERDLFKDSIFRENGVKLFRIPADQADKLPEEIKDALQQIQEGYYERTA